MPDMILSPNDGQLVWLGGLGIQFKLDGTNTQDAFAVVEHPLEPGAFAPPHTHSREDEFSYVLEGMVGVKLGMKNTWCLKARILLSRVVYHILSGIQGQSRHEC
jgi:quercetin dioxygenase-like cupin family protein